MKWAHILYLHSVQNDITFKFSNKISAAHVHWYNNKMKVKYAAQTLSSSTADALEYLNKINVTGFADVEATVEYCRVVDRVFDFLNSKSSFSKGLKSPIFRNNISSLKTIIIPLIKYLYSLKFNNTPLHKSNKKTFIIGFSVAVKSVFSIAETIFSEHYSSLNMNYILTYKFSQDHLELFFAQIRQRCGSNNNPNVVQFKTALKQILFKNYIKCKSNGNCNVFDDDISGGIFEFKWYRRQNNIDEITCNEELDEDICNRLVLLNTLNTSLAEAKNNILFYILGYIIRGIVNNLSCNSCITYLHVYFQKYLTIIIVIHLFLNF